MLKRWSIVLLVLVSGLAMARPPKLTLFISVDSLGSDVLQRNRARFKYGFARLLTEGAVFPAARYEIAECVTGIGHSTMVTGTYPHRHGVVGNKVFNRATGKLEACFADAAHPVLEAPAAVEDVSPMNLLAETLSDRLRAATMLKGRSVAISGKGRAAVALAGRLGDAYWFHEQVGKFVTGTWYKKEFPAWVRTFNERKLPDGYHGKQWELTGAAKDYLGDDERPFESDWYGMTKVFPHPLSGGLPSPGPQSYSALASSPLMNEVMVEFAKAALDGEQLGKDDVPDLLSVSFSPLDRTYHLYGPTSWEMQDHLVKLDKALGELLSAAERAAGGKQNLLVVLTGDHGGANIPEEWASLGLDGLRVAPAAIQKGLSEELEKKFGVPNLVAALEEVDVYLDQKAIEAKKLDGAAVRRAAAAWLSKQPELQLGVARDDLLAVQDDALGRVLRNSFHPERSGDVLMVMKPFRVLESEKAGTSHGTPWSYDADVPIFLFGKGIKAGAFTTEAHPTDLAPTVAAILEMGAPASSEGRVLSDAVQLGR
ncbi:MAG: alkaline phosphatase family protein [Myxococcota bacterium]